jgi:dTDP-glucose 4,6-dehydratase
VYNIGASNEWSNLDITHAVLDHLNKPRTLIKYVEDRLGHDRRYAIDSHKTQTQLGWAPQKSFKQGLAETIDWYLANPQWMQNVLKRQQAEKQKTTTV